MHSNNLEGFVFLKNKINVEFCFVLAVIVSVFSFVDIKHSRKPFRRCAVGIHLLIQGVFNFTTTKKTSRTRPGNYKILSSVLSISFFLSVEWEGWVSGLCQFKAEDLVCHT